MSRSDPAELALLLGVLALRLELARRDALIAAWNAWSLAPSGSFATTMLEARAIVPEAVPLLERLANDYLALNGGDPARSLARLRAGEILGPDSPRLADPGLRSRIERAGVDPGCRTDPFATVVDPGDWEERRGRDRFRATRLHARGGLGEIFLARDEVMERDVALKEIQPRYADHAESRARFLREAKITGSLEHPGVVPIYALGHQPDGRPYYTMRFIDGESLRQSIAAHHGATPAGSDPGPRRLGLRRLLRRFVDVCNTIDFAHSRGVLHRDLKPDNIMLGRYGETLVVDWGLAKALGDPGPTPSPPGWVRTKTGSTMGTPAYMSPEQAAGHQAEVGAASDIYSLGATLYHLLTARPPFEGTSLDELLADVRKGRFPRPRALRPDVPRALEAICLKAMALKPAQRYGSARALADDIERWLADEPVSAYRDWPPKRLWRWGRRHRWVAATIGVLSVAVVGVFLFSSLVVASVAITLAIVGGGVGALAGLIRGKARDGAQRGAALGFRVGTIVAVLIFLLWLAYETFHLAVTHPRPGHSPRAIPRGTVPRPIGP